MRQTIASALAVTMLIAMGDGVIAAEADGIIKSVDLAKHEITFENGHSFVFPASVDLALFEPGERARIEYRMSDGRSEASAIFAHGEEIFGQVKEVDVNAHKVTLDNDHTFVFPDTVDITDIKEGERVRIMYSMDGGETKASDITILWSGID